MIDRLSDAQIDRYARQLVLPSIGVAGQLALSHGHVQIIGCGGLGANAALALAQAGVGRLDLFDPDQVDLSNLHRQPFTTDQIGQNKAQALAHLIQERNGEIRVRPTMRPLTIKWLPYLLRLFGWMRPIGMPAAAKSTP